jgi:hypothetical protein
MSTLMPMPDADVNAEADAVPMSPMPTRRFRR